MSGPVALVLEFVALAVLVAAAAGLVHRRVQLVPAGLALAVLAHLVRHWPG
jgi:hypothetical protein